MSSKDKEIRTFHTTLRVDDAQAVVLEASAFLLSSTKRKLFVDMQSHGTSKEQNRALKTRYILDYGISGRHFNGMWNELKALIDSNMSNKKNHIEDLKKKIASTKKTIAKIKKQRISPKNKTIEKFKKQKLNRREKIRNLKIKLCNQERKLKGWQQDLKDKKVRVTFGTNKLFKAQYYLEENKFKDHKDWRKAWNHARNNQFYLLGSHDESWGNSNCQMTENSDGTFDVELTIPLALVKEYGKKLYFKNVSFGYGCEALSAAVTANEERKAIPVKNKEERKEKGHSITYRFRKDDKGRWMLYAMLDIPNPDIVSRHYKYGVIGVDINQDHWAIVETDRFGNPIKFGSIPCVTYGKSSDQSIAIIGEASKELNEWAIATKKPIVLENLDFKKKKRQLAEYSPEKARQLSSFAYSAILRIIQSRAYQFGIETFKVNPAFTSIIGRLKFADRYNLSVHQGAALAIGRRKMGFSERPPKSALIQFKAGTDIHGTFPSPARIDWKHEWCWWKSAARELQSAVARQYRKQKKAIRQSQAKSQSGNIRPRDGVDQVGCDEKTHRGSRDEIPERRRHNCSDADSDSLPNESGLLLTFVNKK
ncbi:hypothetical protein LCGC14_1646880 [marine sediment metagenome]|uniref:Uncharacterized protein n=1 Tax=marine sediment metagenome TaxID=412755 RepID=A0A0F9IKH3_9ZZZZ